MKQRDKVGISLETAQKIAQVWDKAETVSHAMELAGLKTKDVRNHYRYRRLAEQLLGINLDTPKKHTKQATYERVPQRTRRVDFKGEALIINFSDCHWWPNQKATDAHKILLKMIDDLKPQGVACRGDMMDGANLSRFPRRYGDTTPSTEDEVITCIEYMEEIADIATQARRKVDLDINVGNHERIEIVMANMREADGEVVSGLLAGAKSSDKTPMEIFFPAWNISTSTIINDTFLWKHKPVKGGIHARRNSVLNAGINVGNGHTHRLGVTYVSDYQGTRHGVECGTLADPLADQFFYVEDNPTDWQSGFVVQIFKDKQVESYPIHVIDGKARFNGKVYKA